MVANFCTAFLVWIIIGGFLQAVDFNKMLHNRLKTNSSYILIF